MTMKQRLKEIPLIYDTWLAVKNRLDKRRWLRSGKPIPAPHVIKKEAVLDYGRQFGLDTLIETGTYHGLMLWATRKTYREIHTVELDDALFARAKRIFSRFPNVHLWHGDSGTLLKDLSARVQRPAVFFLDAHIAGPGTSMTALETPIMQELETVFSRKYDDVILIDDARYFDGTHDYPRLEEVAAFVRERRPRYQMNVEDDIIRITPPRQR
jgi:hypothetical protein